MPKKNKYKSNRAPYIPPGAHFVNSFSAAVADHDRFETTQKSNKRKITKKLKKEEH